MSRYLVTGASGFIGQHLAEALVARGEAVRCLVRPSSNTRLLESLGVELAHGDLQDPRRLAAAADGVDVVFHLAGMTAAFSDADFLRVNRDGTANVARVCAEADRAPLHVVVSSVAAAGPAPRDGVRSEHDEPQPISRYGRSKRAAEIAAEAYADRVPTTVVRPGIVFGPRNLETLPIFKTISRLRVHPVVGRRTPRLSLIYIDDLVEILIRAAAKGRRIAADQSQRKTGEGYYFACAPQYPDYVEWGEMIKRALDRPYAPTLRMIRFMPWLAASCNELIARGRGRPGHFNRDKILEACATSWACSCKATSRELDFTPPRSLQQRTEETVQWYREHRWL